MCIQSLFRHKVLKLLLSEERTGEELVETPSPEKIPVSAFTTRSKLKLRLLSGFRIDLLEAIPGKCIQCYTRSGLNK